jgi:aldehyde:ferredoxin oxidoreductase
MIFASGPLGGLSVAGGGTYSVVTKGPLTNGAATCQANGFFGAYMRLSGLDGIIIQGASPEWVYLHVHDGKVEIRDASPYVGLDTWQMQDAVTAALGKTPAQVSVVGIGPAGENLVKFACVAGDKGHVAGHNGTGAVMGAKKLKMIVAERGKARIPLADSRKVASTGKAMIEFIRTDPGSYRFEWGTSMGYAGGERAGWLPVKNYQTNIFPPATAFMGENYRPKWKIERHACWACPMKHIHMIEITDGPYQGFVGEEPEYEQWAAWGSLIENPDPAGALVLSNVTDRLGMENNELGWVVAFAMECYQRGILTSQDFGGLTLEWGSVDTARQLVDMIAHRRGIGDVLAEGVMRASARLAASGKSEAALSIGVFTMKGNSPRGHDHRRNWGEMFDTITSSTGTLETGPVVSHDPPPAPNTSPFNPDEIVARTANYKGRMLFEDCLGMCRLCIWVPLTQVLEAVNGATGWDMTYQEAFDVGRRIAQLLKVFNLRHGVSPEMDRPSPRYGSTPVDGPAKGVSILPHLDNMLRDYYSLMGWDPKTGKPTPETLRRYGLDFAIEGLYPNLEAPLPLG